MVSNINFNQPGYNPFPIQEAASEYATKMANLAARQAAGKQYAGGDIAGAARTIAGTGDFETAGKLTDRGTLLSAGEKYAAGDYAGAGGILAKGGQLTAAETLADKQIAQIQKQQDMLGRVGSSLESPEAAADPALAAQLWQLGAQNLQAAGVKPETIAKLGQLYSTNPKQAIAFMKAQAARDLAFETTNGVTRVLDKKNGDLIHQFGEPSLFGNSAEGLALGILASQGKIDPVALARAYATRPTTQVDALGNIITKPAMVLPEPGGAAGTSEPPPSAGTVPPPPAPNAPGTTTRYPGGVTITQTGAVRIPPAIQRQEDADLDVLTTGTTIDQDLGAFQAKIESGKLPLGPGSNVANSLRNRAGWSTEGSRYYGDFRAALEDMRNRSLLLAKGVQTEGDAQRAWNALFQSLNDPKAVAQRLAEIRGQNARNAQLAVQKINLRRRNNRLPAYDFTGLQIPESPFGAPPPAAGTNTPPVRIENDEDFDKLRSGTKFIGPDNQVRTKP